MVLSIQIGLLKIPVMPVNFVNSRYAVTGLHQFSKCCNARVRQKKICEKCDKTLLATEIQKGLSEDTILSEEQTEELKEFLENGIIEVLGFEDFKENDLLSLVPYIQKTQLILPNISKGFKKTDIRTYFSFISALKEMKKLCIVKLVQRAVEHLGILTLYNNELLFIETPFKKYHNIDDVVRLKEMIKNVVRIEKINDLEEFKEQAKDFINSFDNKVTKLEEATEDKAEKLEEFITNIKSGNIKKTKKKIGVETKITTKNPFLLSNK